MWSGWVRKWAGERKVGHAGTLDPAATGVLPVALNDGTRVLEFLSDASKAYRAEITFGVETDSVDGDGTVTAVRAVAFSDGDLNHALDGFRGSITQRPPAHSAIKIGGKRAYDLARAGTEVEIPERHVTIFALDIVEREQGHRDAGHRLLEGHVYSRNCTGPRNRVGMRRVPFQFGADTKRSIRSVRRMDSRSARIHRRARASGRQSLSTPIRRSPHGRRSYWVRRKQRTGIMAGRWQPARQSGNREPACMTIRVIGAAWPSMTRPGTFGRHYV